MLRGLGALAGIAAWLGWLTLCPALGFPSLATAAMLNRVVVPREDPGSWLGWGLLFIGLAAAALLYLAALPRGRLRPSIASGVLYGAICWLVVGAVVMPLLGVIAPAPAASTSSAQNPADPMQGSFMMLPLGLGAPVAALIAWVMFGAVIGAAGASASAYPSLRQLATDVRRGSGGLRSPRTVLLGALLPAVMIVLVVLVAIRVSGSPSAATVTGTQTLATEHEQALPKGAEFFSVIELSQPPGATLGPHAHSYFGFAYGLRGVATLAYSGGQTTRVTPGSVGFIGVQVGHAHENTDDRLPSAALALLIVGLAVAVCLFSSPRGRSERLLLPVALVLLLGVGALGALDPWANDWLFLSVRPTSGHGAPMPLATASRTYESPDFGPLTAGPYTETFDEVTVAPSGEADISSAGAVLLFVVDGQVQVDPTGGAQTRLATHGATVLKPGTSARLTDASDRPAHLLEVIVTPTSPTARTRPHLEPV